MAPPDDRRSALSSMAATVDDLVRRVAALAEASAGMDADRVAKGSRGSLSVSQELYEAERALAEAGRRLRGVADALAG
ncbi:MAG: hypothetical protein ABR511_07990 [Acidimicrobiales bacterium]